MVYHWFTDSRIWASLGKAGITKIAYDFRRDLRTADKGSIDKYYRDLGKSRITKIAYNFKRDQLTSTKVIWAGLGLQKSPTTLGEILGLHNCAVADKGSIDEYYRDLDKAGIKKVA